MPFDTAAFVGANAQGFNFLNRGITDAGNTIANRIQQHQQEAKKLKAYQAMAVDGLGMDADEVSHMDAATLEGKLQSVAVRSAMQRLQAEQQQQQDEQGQAAAYPKFMEALNPEAPGGIGPRAPVDVGRFINAAQTSGYRLPPQVLTQMMKENDATNWADVMPRPFEVGGVKGAVGKSGQFQFLPQATPDSLTAIPVLDDQGNVLGMRVPTAKGGSAPVPQRQAKPLPEAYNTRLVNLQDELDSATRTAGKSDDELAKLRMGTPAQVRTTYQDRARKALNAIADHVARFREQGYADDSFWQNEHKRLGLPTTAAAASATAAPTATNPKTGEKLIWKDGSWQPLKP